MPASPPYKYSEHTLKDGTRILVSMENDAETALSPTRLEDAPTESAEEVAAALVYELGQHGHDLTECRVIHRNKRGTWDELLVEDGAFAGFRSLGGVRDLPEALRRIGGDRGRDPSDAEIVGMTSGKDRRSADYAALKEPTGTQYEAEKQRILREHGREAMLAFAKKEHLHDYLAETGGLDAHDVLAAKDLDALAKKPGSKWEQVAREFVGRAPTRPKEPDDHEPER